jgi:aspartate/methionine/tyrosine aminotransferase
VEAGVTAIPVSAFYGADAPKHFIRFCFSKQDQVLDAALERLAAFAGRRGAKTVRSV